MKIKGGPPIVVQPHTPPISIQHLHTLTYMINLSQTDISPNISQTKLF